MDDEALRAMMPMSFGKAGRKGAKAAAQNPAPPSAASASASASVPARAYAPVKGPTRPPVGFEKDADEAISKNGAKREELAEGTDYDDDGLTAEEREANRRAMEAQGSDEEEDDDEDDENDLGPEPMGLDSSAGIPLESKVELRDHKKAITAMSLDGSGARVATGSFDYEVKLWDFGGMSSSFRPHKTFEPAGSYPVTDLAWSQAGDSLLVTSGTAQAKLFDREGRLLTDYKKGDVYIRDMRHTSGHVAEITSCCWHPTSKNIFATASADSSVRLWDADEKLKQQTVIVVKSKERGTRTKVTSCRFTNDGKMLAAGCEDGALHLWSTSGTYSRPNATVEGAHTRGSGITSLAFSNDGRCMATRGGSGDDSVKLWDVRSFKRPLAERGELPTHYSSTSVIFSLDESAILTGTTEEKGPGSIQVLSRSDLSPLRAIPVPDDDHDGLNGATGGGGSVIKLQWHPKINQLFASTSTGTAHVFYSSTSSVRGALLCVGKRAKARRDHDGMMSTEIEGPIITPGAQNAEDRGQGMGQMAKKRKMEKMRQDPRATKMPERPLEGPGKGGRIGSAATQHMVQGIFRDNSRSEDPREALLKYADKADSDPKWTNAWAKTQPKTIYSQDDNDGDGQDKSSQK